jgi:hypothetical protein
MVNSLENEAVDISKLGIEIIVISVLLTTVVIFALYSRFLFSKEEYRKYQTRYMNETSENWTFESRAEKAEKALYLLNTISAITDRGNNAEVRRKKDGSLTVYEVKKNIVTV